MCTPTEIACKFVVLAFDPVIQFVKRHVGHLTNYRDSLRKLEDELRKLDEKKNEVRGEVHQAEVRGRVIDVKVTEWLDAVDGVMQGVMDFTTDETHKENVSCFKLSYPHIIWRYKLSKQALGKIDGVQDFINKGNCFSAISHPAPPPSELQFPSASNYERFGSREKVFESIVVALKDPQVKMIGIYGAGGIGKTTMVETIGKQLKEDGTFDEVVLAPVSQVVNVEQIQKRITSILSPPPEGHGAQQLTERLRNVRKNLIILDDVWHDLNLMEIGIPLIDGNSKGCKVVMTSRNLEVRDKNIPVDRKFSLPILEDTEAWALFITKVGSSVESDFELRDVAKAVCRECRGLPVAIATVGAALKAKEMYVWLNALKQLKKSIIDKKVYNCLKLSYDSLELDQAKDAQTCFLLCCFFPEDAEIPIDDLMRHCMAKRLLVQDPDTIQEARLAAYVAVDTLKTRCLLLQGRDEHYVKVHDVIRDFSISMAKDDEKIAFLVNHNLCEWPERGTYERYSALCLRSKNFGEIPNQLACPQLHTLMLDCVHDHHPPEFRNGFFRGMKTLTVLELYQWHMAVLSPSFTDLVNLRMLTLDGCYVEDITRLKDLKSNLEMLNFRGSYIKSLPPEIGELTRLRLLDMRDCRGLELIPRGVISKLTRLEELYIPDEDEFTQCKASTAANLGELMALKRLTTLSIHIPDVALFPKDLCFDNLVNFDVMVGRRRTEFYEDVTSKCSLKLACIPFIAQFNILLERAELVHLRRVKFLKTLQNDSGGRVGFLKLKYLCVDYCDDIEHLFGKTNWFVRREELINLPSPAPFGKLTVLHIFESSFKYLFSPSCAMGLQQLERLWIGDCVMMEEIVGAEVEPTNYMINFSRLKYLRLVSLPKLISFYPKMEKTATTVGNSSSYAESLFNEKLAFPALEILEIWKLSRITEIWDKTLFPPNSFCQLTEMNVKKCCKLKNLLPVNMVAQLKNLRVVKVSHCREMEVIITEMKKGGTSNDIIRFPQLQRLQLGVLKKLKGFISKPQIFFNCQVTLPKLEKLYLVNCANFERCIFGMLHGSLNLRALIVRKCGGVREVFHLDDGDGQQVSLLTEVTVIGLSSLPQLTCLWNKDPHGLVGLGNLTHIMIVDCPNLRYLFSFSIATALKQLKNLLLDSCEMLEEVIATNEGLKQVINDTELVFPMLKFLILLNLPNFKRLCSANCTLNSPSLRNVVVKWCPKMQTYPLGIVQLPQIKVRIDDKEIQLKDLNNYLEQQVLNEEEFSMMDENWRGNILELIEYHSDSSDMDDGITSDSDAFGSETSDSDEYDKEGPKGPEADDTPSVA